jgi:uncharacterized protein (TIGR04222 family)
MLHIAADTWGIKSQTFLWLYGGLCVVWGVALVWWRSNILGRDSRSKWRPADYELALLSGGPELAVTAAAARLRADGALEPGDRRHTLRANLDAPARQDTLEREVLAAATGSPHITFRRLRAEVARGPAVNGMAAHLIKEGLLLSAAQRAQLRWLWASSLPLLALGVARLVAGVNNHKPVTYLVFIILAVFAFPLIVGGRRRWTTNRGERLLELRRLSQRGWRAKPEQITPALAVALFGGGALWALDPAFAAAMAMPRGTVAGWASGSGTYYGSGCGSAGAGGGGCGGGGCGGGGCGGGGGGGGGCGG